MHQAKLSRTTYNREQFPLLCLPAELRHKIYAYAFDTITIDFACNSDWDGLRGGSTEIIGSGAGLLRACRQTRPEAARFMNTYTHTAFGHQAYWDGFLEESPLVKRHNIQSVTFPGEQEAGNIFPAIAGDAGRLCDKSLEQRVKSYVRSGQKVTPYCPSLKTIYLDCQLIDDFLLQTVISQVSQIDQRF